MGEGDWAAAKHGGRGRRGWKKLHLGVDRSGVIVARALTEASVDDATTGITLIEATDGALGRVTADAAYDTIGFYEAAGARGATVVVPPTRTANVSRYGPRSSARDRTILAVKERGRRRWKKTSGYHGQARVENAFFRYTSIIGDSLRACSPAGRGPEVVLACNVLNQMTELGRPESYSRGLRDWPLLLGSLTVMFRVMHQRVCRESRSRGTRGRDVIRRNLVRNPVRRIQSHPAKVGRQPEPSDAWAWGDVRARSVHREPVGRSLRALSETRVVADPGPPHLACGPMETASLRAVATRVVQECAGMGHRQPGTACVVEARFAKDRARDDRTTGPPRLEAVGRRSWSVRRSDRLPVLGIMVPHGVAKARIPYHLGPMRQSESSPPSPPGGGIEPTRPRIGNPSTLQVAPSDARCDVHGSRGVGAACHVRTTDRHRLVCTSLRDGEGHRLASREHPPARCRHCQLNESGPE